MIVKNVRLKKMEQYVIDHDFVSMDELCEVFEISKNTARSDVAELVEKGVIEKKYGGVSVITTRVPTSYQERTEKNKESKKEVGRLAATLLEEGDLIYIDAGTTTSFLVAKGNQLPQQLTIITNNVNVINQSFRENGFTVFSLPGKLNREMNSFISLETIDSLKNYNIKKAFIGARGVSGSGDISVASAVDAKLKEMVLSISECSILMTDFEKFKSAAMINFSHLNKFDYWVCEKSTPEMQEIADNYGVKLLTTTSP